MTTDNNKRQRRRRWPWVVGVIAVLGLVLVAVPMIGGAGARQAAQATAQGQSGQVVAAFTGDLSSAATASGNVEAAREARLSLELAGKIVDVPVSIGDAVQAGDVLVQLDTAALERSVANAELALTIQEANLKDLINGSSAADLASAQAGVASVQANLDKVKAGADPDDIQAARQPGSGAGILQRRAGRAGQRNHHPGRGQSEERRSCPAPGPVSL